MSTSENIVWSSPDGTTAEWPAPPAVLDHQTPSTAADPPWATSAAARRHRRRDRLVVSLVLAPFVVMATIAGSSWLGDASVGVEVTPPAEVEAAAHRCNDEIQDRTGAGLAAGTVRVVVADRHLQVDGVSLADGQRLVRCEVGWSPGFTDVEVRVVDAPTPT